MQLNLFFVSAATLLQLIIGQSYHCPSFSANDSSITYCSFSYCQDFRLYAQLCPSSNSSNAPAPALDLRDSNFGLLTCSSSTVSGGINCTEITWIQVPTESCQTFYLGQQCEDCTNVSTNYVILLDSNTTTPTKTPTLFPSKSTILRLLKSKR